MTSRSVGVLLLLAAAAGATADGQVQRGAPAARAAASRTRPTSRWKQAAYVKASNPRAGAQFGFSAALSADGSTLAVGSPMEESAASGVNGNQDDHSMFSAGAVYVYVRGSGGWSQQAYIKASNTGPDDQFGYSISLSGDGNQLIVGAIGEDSAATGVNGNQQDNAAPNSGAAYVFTRSGSTWNQQAYLKAANAMANFLFGYSVAFSSDG